MRQTVYITELKAILVHRVDFSYTVMQSLNTDARVSFFKHLIFKPTSFLRVLMERQPPC